MAQTKNRMRPIAAAVPIRGTPTRPSSRPTAPEVLPVRRRVGDAATSADAGGVCRPPLVWVEACTVRPFGSALGCPEGGGVVSDPLGEGARGAAEDSFHFAGDGCGVRDLPG